MKLGAFSVSLAVKDLAASKSFYEKLGFQKIGQFIEVGFKFNSYIDVGYWEKLLS